MLFDRLSPGLSRCAAPLALMLVLLAACPVFGADDADARRDRMLQGMLRQPYPPDGLWHYENLAMAAYFLGQKDKGDQAIMDAQAAMAKDVKMADFHWHAYILERIYFLFSGKSRHFPGRMGPKAEKALVTMLWDWASPDCRAEMTLPERDWWVWNSENHHMQAWGGYWGAAHILAQHPDFSDRKYADGSSPAEMAKAFDEYFKRWITNRASVGLLVECNSNYNKYTMGPLYNMADFADDKVLKKRAGMMLDLLWADWAVEQIDGIRGGSRHRCYPGASSITGAMGGGEAWFHFGVGQPLSKHPAHICAATSFYRPPRLLSDLVLNTAGRGSYAYVSRRPGLAASGPSPASAMGSVGGERTTIAYNLDPKCPSLARYSWCTPDFILGTSMVKSLNEKAWTGISSQNRWEGVIFGGHPTARIFASPLTPAKGSVHNSNWSVQSKGVLIVQRLKTSNAVGQRIWFDGALQPVEKDGWVFVEAPRAFAAVRVVQGQTAWEADDPKQHHEKDNQPAKGKWLACKDQFSPVIIEVARKADCKDFKAFQQTVGSSPLSVDGAVCRYTSNQHKTSLTLWADYSQVPQVDGKAVNYEPAKAYDCPFIQGQFGSGIVTLSNGAQKLVLDFTADQ